MLLRVNLEDGALGFPQVADSDPQRESIDDELCFRVTGVRVIEKYAARGRTPFDNLIQSMIFHWCV